MRFHHDHDDAFLEPRFETRAIPPAPNADAVSQLAHENRNLRAAIRKQQDEMEAKDREIATLNGKLRQLQSAIQRYLEASRRGQDLISILNNVERSTDGL